MESNVGKWREVLLNNCFQLLQLFQLKKSGLKALMGSSKEESTPSSDIALFPTICDTPS